METKIPEFLYDTLKKQYDGQNMERILTGYMEERPVTLRANTLKTTREKVEKELEQMGIPCRQTAWYPDALILCGVREKAVQETEMYRNGEIYLQSLSSMIPPVFMNPGAGECILDMAAAPGGKTTQMAALSGGRAQITACERDRIRAERLRYNLEKQGAAGAYVMVEDARKLDSFFSFDKILLDAPCSGSGTILLSENRPPVRFTGDFLKKCVKSQRQLLKKALELLKPGCEMMYSTCSVLKEENEEAVKAAVASGMAEMVPLSAESLPGVPMLPVTMEGVLCICPDALYEGFFVAKLRKKK